MSAAGAVDEERIATLEAAVTALDETSVTRARLLANLAMELMYSPDHERRARLSHEALELARRLGDPATLAHVIIGRFNAISRPHTLPERLLLTAELLDVAERLGDPAVSTRAWFVRHRVALEAGDMDEADRAIDAFTELVAALGQPSLRWAVAWNRAGRHLLAGRIAQADAEVHAALELAQASGQPDARAFYYNALFWLRFEQGRLEELEETWPDVIIQFPGISAFRPMLALLYCELDRESEARRVLQPIAASGFDVPLDVLWGQTVTDWAAVCSYLGDTANAALLRERLEPYARQLALPAGGIANGAIAHYLGLLATTLGDHEEAEAQFRTAGTFHERIGAPSWLARTRLEWARMLLTRRQPGDADRARELLGQTLATARELGLAKVERDAVALLQ
jgi:tetratricopeptide (TPR) repeat protein